MICSRTESGGSLCVDISSEIVSSIGAETPIERRIIRSPTIAAGDSGFHKNETLKRHDMHAREAWNSSPTPSPIWRFIRILLLMRTPFRNVPQWWYALKPTVWSSSSVSMPSGKRIWISPFALMSASCEVLEITISFE